MYVIIPCGINFHHFDAIKKYFLNKHFGSLIWRCENSNVCFYSSELEKFKAII